MGGASASASAATSVYCTRRRHGDVNADGLRERLAFGDMLVDESPPQAANEVPLKWGVCQKEEHVDQHRCTQRISRSWVREQKIVTPRASNAWAAIQQRGIGAARVLSGATL